MEVGKLYRIELTLEELGILREMLIKELKWLKVLARGLHSSAADVAVQRYRSTKRLAQKIPLGITTEQEK